MQPPLRARCECARLEQEASHGGECELARLFDAGGRAECRGDDAP